MKVCSCAQFPQTSLDGGNTFISLRQASRLLEKLEPDDLQKAVMLESDGTKRPITEKEIDEILAFAAEESELTE